MLRSAALLAAGLALVAYVPAAATAASAGGPIRGCEVTVPTGTYAAVTLDFDLPAAGKADPFAGRWTVVGAMMDGRTAVDHGAGVREPGGVLTTMNTFRVMEGLGRAFTCRAAARSFSSAVASAVHG